MFDKMSLLNNNENLIKTLLMVYLLLSSSSLQPLLSKRYREFVESDRIIQHIFMFITILLIITILSTDSMNNLEILFYSVIGYLVFIFTTKIDIHLNLVILILFTGGLLYMNSLKKQDKLIESDQTLSEEDKIKKKSKYNISSFVIISILVALTIICMLLYSNKKHVQYGGGYSLVNFLLY